MINFKAVIDPRLLDLGNNVLGPKQRQQMLFVVGQDMVEEIGQQFDTQGVHFLGRRWQDLSERRKSERAAKGTWPGLILQDTGNLKRSRNNIATDSVATVRLTANYASTHEQGEDNIPQRKILPPENVAKTVAIKSAQAYIDIVVKGIG